MQNEPIEVTLVVTRVLEKLNIPYFISGSLASTLYGMVRTTQDSDIVTEMYPLHTLPFVSALQNDFYLDEEMITDSIQRHSSFNMIHRETMFKVDVFIPQPRPFFVSQLSRAQNLTIQLNSDLQAKFSSPEDVILAKLEWYRLGGEVSERQWRDIQGIMMTRSGDLDLTYLRRWAIELNVNDLLDRAMKEIS